MSLTYKKNSDSSETTVKRGFFNEISSQKQRKGISKTQAPNFLFFNMHSDAVRRKNI